jgi:hypothetical protein
MLKRILHRRQCPPPTASLGLPPAPAVGLPKALPAPGLPLLLMTLFWFILAPSLCLVPSVCLAQVEATPTPPPVQHNDAASLKAIAVATAFMDSLINNAPPETLSAMCSLPFCHDDTVIVLTRAALNTALSQLLSASAAISKKNRPRVDSAYVLDVRKEVLFGMVPINIYFSVLRLKFSQPGREPGKEAAKLLIFAIQVTDEARIVGIQD